MLCIVQVFECAEGASQANKEEGRFVLCHQQTIASQTRTILEVTSQHELNKIERFALCSDEMGCVCC